MPRAEPLAELEVSIGRRLMKARKELLIHRTACALKLQISTDRLISYEFGRAKLPWSVGSVFCDTFRVNPIWLYDGSGTAWRVGFVDIAGQTPIDPRDVFSDVMGKFLTLHPEARDFLNDSSATGEPPKGPFLTPEEYGDAYVFSGQIQHWFDTIHPDQRREFLAALKGAGDKLADRYKRIPGTRQKPTAQKNPAGGKKT